MNSKNRWPQLVHVASERVFPLRINGTTSFGRAPGFYNYGDFGINRWRETDAQVLKGSHYISLTDDNAVSRTHGVIYHTVQHGQLIYQDLNSQNGTVVNFQGLTTSTESAEIAQKFHLPTRFPTIQLNDGDTLIIGSEEFGIEFLEDPIGELQQRRTALLIEGLAGHAQERFHELEETFVDRGFARDRIQKVDLLSESTLSNFDTALRSLTEKGYIHNEGTTCIVITCQAKNSRLLLNGEVVDIANNFINFFDRIPGTKIIVLETNDPADSFHEMLFSRGFKDTVLISDSSLLKPTPENKKSQLSEVMTKLFDTVSPILHIDALSNSNTDSDYVITIGQNERDLDSYGGLIHSLDFVLGSSFSSSLRKNHGQFRG